MFLTEDGATWVGRIGDNQTGCPLVDQALHVLQVDLPGLVWLQMEDACQDGWTQL